MFLHLIFIRSFDFCMRLCCELFLQYRHFLILELVSPSSPHAIRHHFNFICTVSCLMVAATCCLGSPWICCCCCFVNIIYKSNVHCELTMVISELLSLWCCLNWVLLCLCGILYTKGTDKNRQRNFPVVDERTVVNFIYISFCMDTTSLGYLSFRPIFVGVSSFSLPKLTFTYLYTIYRSNFDKLSSEVSCQDSQMNFTVFFHLVAFSWAGGGGGTQVWYNGLFIGKCALTLIDYSIKNTLTNIAYDTINLNLL